MICRLSVVCFGVLGLSVCSAPVARADLLAIPADNGSSSAVVLRFDDRTGVFIEEFGHESEAYEGITMGPDEKMYVTSNILGYGDVYRFNRNGTYVGQFTTGDLRIPGRLTFGPDGNCYVIGGTWPESPPRWQILRYNAVSGAFMNYFITNAGTPVDLAFGRDGQL